MNRSDFIEELKIENKVNSLSLCELEAKDQTMNDDSSKICSNTPEKSNIFSSKGKNFYLITKNL